jgi:Integrase zinc binding domain
LLCKLIDDHFCPVVPDSSSSSSSISVILSDLHNSALGGHLGYKKLLKLVSTRFYWRGIHLSIK